VSRRPTPLIPSVRGVFPAPRRTSKIGGYRSTCVRAHVCREAAAARQWDGVDCSACPVPEGIEDFDVPAAIRGISERRTEFERAVAGLRSELLRNRTPRGGEEKLEMSPRKGQKRTRYARIEEFTGDAAKVLGNALEEGWGATRTHRALERVLLPSDLPSVNGVARYLRRKRGTGVRGKTGLDPAVEGGRTVNVWDAPPASGTEEPEKVELSPDPRSNLTIERGRGDGTILRMPASARLGGVGRPFEVRPDGSVLCPDAASAAALSLEIRRLNDLAALGAEVEASADRAEAGE